MSWEVEGTDEIAVAVLGQGEAGARRGARCVMGSAAAGPLVDSGVGERLIKHAQLEEASEVHQDRSITGIVIRD